MEPVLLYFSWCVCVTNNGDLRWLGERLIKSNDDSCTVSSIIHILFFPQIISNPNCLVSLPLKKSPQWQKSKIVADCCVIFPYPFLPCGIFSQILNLSLLPYPQSPMLFLAAWNFYSGPHSKSPHFKVFIIPKISSSFSSSGQYKLNFQDWSQVFGLQSEAYT